MYLVAVLQAVTPFIFPDFTTPAPRDLSFEAGYAIADSGTWAVEFYTRGWGDNAQWVARRSLVIPNGREQITWLTEADCPAMRSVLETLNDYSIGSIRVPYLGPRPQPRILWPRPKGPPTEAATYTVWGRGRQADGSFVDYSVSATAGMVAEWTKMANNTLKSCWTAPRTPG